MTRRLAAILALAVALPASAAERGKSRDFELRAILTVAGARHALFKETSAAGTRHWLRVGEELDDIEMVSLDAAQGLVVIKDHGARKELGMKPPASGGDASPRGVLWLQDASLDDAILIFQRITTRTVLRSAHLSDTPFNLREENFDTPKATDLLAREFDARDLALLRDGKRFAILKDKETPMPVLPNRDQLLESARSTTIATSDTGLVHAGEINIGGEDAATSLKFYGEMARRTVLAPTPLPEAVLFLKNETTLNYWDALYAFDMLLALNGMKSTFLGEKFVAITPPDYDTGALPDPPVEADDSKSVKKGELRLGNPAEKAVAIASPGKAQPAGKRSAKPSHPFKSYQRMTGKKVTPDVDLPGLFISLENRTDLSKPEAAYAIETALLLNGVRLTPIDDKNVRAESLAQSAAANN